MQIYRNNFKIHKINIFYFFLYLLQLFPLSSHHQTKKKKMKSNHTQGEWKATIGTFETDLHLVASTHGVICDIRKSLPFNEQEANARLIASAPDMYEALKEAYKELTYHNWNNCKTGYQILAALSKAEGNI